jgi:Ca2+-binding RTX toxin-like protein
MTQNNSLTETLEPRRLLAAEVVSIEGTSDNDVITIQRSGSSFVVSVNGDQQTFARADVLRFSIDGDDSADRITLTRVNVRAFIDGGDGDDTITGSDKSDRLNGEAGDDEIFAGKGHDVVRGESGEDELFGSIGNDTIVGGSAEDVMKGERGSDLIDANDDFFEDDVRGGKGRDTAEVDDELGIEDDVDDTTEVVND